MAAATSACVALPAARRLRATARGCVRPSSLSRAFAPSSSSPAPDKTLPSREHHVSRARAPPCVPRADASSSPPPLERQTPPRRAAPRRGRRRARDLPPELPPRGRALGPPGGARRRGGDARVGRHARVRFRRARGAPRRGDAVAPDGGRVHALVRVILLLGVGHTTPTRPDSHARQTRRGPRGGVHRDERTSEGFRPRNRLPRRAPLRRPRVRRLRRASPEQVAGELLAEEHAGGHHGANPARRRRGPARRPATVEAVDPAQARTRLPARGRVRLRVGG